MHRLLHLIPKIIQKRGVITSSLFACAFMTSIATSGQQPVDRRPADRYSEYHQSTAGSAPQSAPVDFQDVVKQQKILSESCSSEFLVIDARASRGVRIRESSTCTGETRDLYTQTFCIIFSAQQSRDNRSLVDWFIKPERVQALYDLSILVDTKQAWPLLNRKYHGELLDWTLHQLFTESVRGNRHAVAVLLEFRKIADGDGAEELDDWLYQLIAKHPKPTIHNWPLLRPLVAGDELASTTLFADKSVIVGRYEAYCRETNSADERQVCASLIASLKALHESTDLPR
jgi:hypothetical protein